LLLFFGTTISLFLWEVLLLLKQTQHVQTFSCALSDLLNAFSTIQDEAQSTGGVAAAKAFLEKVPSDLKDWFIASLGEGKTVQGFLAHNKIAFREEV
jgi:hypothetical protein